ncbi:MAG: protein kinase [Pseudomonadota bacterium]|nr:protein kinase [Pseudomonadota bacterium]
MTEIETWRKWESQTINGIFPLRRFLGRSDHSVVFLTESAAQKLPTAAIKLLPADAALAEGKLAQWRRAAELPHPNLLRIFDTGRCKLGGHPFLYLVMEYAEQTMAQILPQRALTSEEVRELLNPTLDVLAFLHGRSMVHSQLKPTNFLVVDDQLKLASDTLRAAGAAATSILKPSVYDPPELRNGVMSAAGDIWGLGVTVTEALTQVTPSWSAEQPETVSLPVALPGAFAYSLRRCLSHNPANRPTISELNAEFGTVQPANSVAPSAAPPGAVPKMGSGPTGRPSGSPSPSSPPPPPSGERIAEDLYTGDETALGSSKIRLAVAAVAASFIALVVIWAFMRPFRTHSASQPPTPSSAAHIALQQPAPAAAAPQAPKTPISEGSVVYEEIPILSRSTRRSIHGRVTIPVHVTVDRSGAVIAETLESRDASGFFRRLALEAAKKWKFTPAESQPVRAWLIQFELSRGGAAAQAIPLAPAS